MSNVDIWLPSCVEKLDQNIKVMQLSADAPRPLAWIQDAVKILPKISTG